MATPQNEASFVHLVAEPGLDKSGPELLDDLGGSLKATNPVNFGLLRGWVSMTELTIFGDSVEGLARYIPGADQSTAIDVPATLAGDGAYARRPVSNTEVPKIHIFADIPERLKYTTGRATLFDVARYSVAMSVAIATKAGAPISVNLVNDIGSHNIFNGRGRDGYVAMQAFDKAKQARAEKPGKGTALASALRSAAYDTNTQEDIVLVASDFLTDYDNENGDFGWQKPLEELQAQLGDRLLVARLKSPAQAKMPVGIARGLSVQDLAVARRTFVDTALIKDRQIAEALKQTRNATIDTGSQRLIKSQIGEFLIS